MSKINFERELDILLVEDNFVNQKLAEAYFKKLGLKVEKAENGRIAVEKVTAKPYDFIFMDLQMPEMDGFEATLKIRTLESEKKPIIIAMTANVFKEDKEKCYAVGMDDFLGKPVKMSDISEVLIKHLKQMKAS